MFVCLRTSARGKLSQCAVIDGWVAHALQLQRQLSLCAIDIWSRTHNAAGLLQIRP